MSSDFWDTGKPLKNDMGMSVGEEKPKIGEEYYYLTLDEKTVKSVEKKKWEDDDFDGSMFLLDNIFKSGIEAEENKDRVIECLKELMSEVKV